MKGAGRRRKLWAEGRVPLRVLRQELVRNWKSLEDRQEAGASQGWKSGKRPGHAGTLSHSKDFRFYLKLHWPLLKSLKQKRDRI